MGDARFRHAYDQVVHAEDRTDAIRRLTDEAVVEALAAASQTLDPLLANVLATEALNRMRRLRASLANLGEGVIALDVEGRIRWANAAAERLLGWSCDEMMLADFHELVQHKDASGEHIPRDACRVLSVARTGIANRGEDDLFTRRDGAQVWVSYNSAPLRSPEGDVQGVVVAFEDCSRRKLAERELAESQQRYKSLFDHCPDAIVTLERDGTIRDANAAAERLTGFPASDVRGMPFLGFVHAADRSSIQALFQEVAQGATRRAAFRVLRADGTDVLVDAWGGPVLVDGVVVGVNGVARPAESRG